MKPESEEPRNPAVIVLGELNGLGVSRGLGRGGVKSYVFDRNRLAPAMWSRHAILVLADRLDGEPLLGQLPLLQSTFDFRPVLYNTHELAVYTIAEHRHRLDDAFHFFLPADETVLDLRDKGRFSRLALKLGRPVPRATAVRRRADLAGLQRLRAPIVVKPTNKQVVHAAKPPGVSVFERPGNTASFCDRTLAEGVEFIVQGWIDGPDDGVVFCLFFRGRDDRTVAMFTSRKLASRTSVRVPVRKRRMRWQTAHLGQRSLLEVLRAPEAGLGFGSRRLVQCELPDAFAFLPQGQRAETALKALGPSGAWWLKDRMEDLNPLFMSRDIKGYSVASTRARLRVRAGFREAELGADHVIAATGYKPDVARRPFLDPALLATIERHAGFPTLNRTYASTVPGRHFLEMLTAGTLGPVMRFVFGGKHSGPAIAQAAAADHRHRTVRRSPRGTETPCWRQARGRRRDGGGPVPRTAVPAKAQHPRETRPSV